MNTSGWFSVHREIFLKLEGKSSDFKWFWLWIISQANFNVACDLKPGQFYTTMSDMRDSLKVSNGPGFVRPGNKKIHRYINILTNEKRMSHRVSHLHGQRVHLITVLNYTEYQGEKRKAVPMDVPMDVPLPGSIPIIDNKDNNVTADAEPKNPEKFIYEVAVKIPQGLKDHMETGTMPAPYLTWGTKACEKNKVDVKHVQDLFDEWVTWWAGAGKKKQDWYATWQNRLKQIKWDYIRAVDQKHYNHGYEASHKGKFDGSQLPPELGSTPDSWRP